MSGRIPRESAWRRNPARQDAKLAGCASTGMAAAGAAVFLAMLAKGCTVAEDAPYFVDSGTLLIDADNVESYGEDLKVVTAGIAETFPTQYLTCP